MAKSPAHTFGEMIGNFFEQSMKQPVSEIAQRYNLYFDTHGYRPAREGKNVTWTDIHGSKHNLDYVFERNGTYRQLGTPVAFIELAWRRYTKHSKNKVQEITGAIEPIAERFKDFSPVKGAMLCGDFTQSAIQQLEGLGYVVLYMPFDRLVNAFAKFGVDINFDPDTKDNEFKNKIRHFNKIKHLDEVAEALLTDNNDIIREFITRFEYMIKKSVKEVLVLPLHGKSMIINDIESAIDFIKNYHNLPADATICKYLVVITYNNNLSVRGEFEDATSAIEFLNKVRSNI